MNTGEKNLVVRKTLAAIMMICCMAGSCAAEPMNAIARDGAPAIQIIVADDAPATDQNAAKILADHLKQITGAEFSIVNPSRIGDKPAIAVGPRAAMAIAPDLDLSLASLGQEGIVLRSIGLNLVLTGADGASRGTLYAVHTFLGDICGVRWWSPRESHVPNNPSLEIPSLDVRYVPPLEYREIHAIDAFDPDWAVRNRINGNSSDIPQAMGTHVVYAESMFVHTFEVLVPHAEHFAAHPEWFSEIDGKRVPPPGLTQLCLTNAALLEFVKQKVRSIAARIPADTEAIVSISQNDNQAYCQCADCRKVAAEEGSESGAMLRFVNAIADDIAQSHPRIAIDTLAYQYTRRPPKLTKPRDNVIVRLCSYECSYAQPYTDPINQAFADDVRDWSQICDRLYVWDYNTNFRHYVHPHPILYALGPNVKFFVDNGVKGLFEQGNRHSQGGDFAVLKQWVLAQLLWNPSLDGSALIDQFESEYYESAATDVAAYIQLRHEAVGDAFVGVSDNHLASYLSPEVLAKSYDLLEQAKSRVAGNAELVGRVEQVEAPVLHAIVRGWSERRQVSEMRGKPWPLSQEYGFYLDELARIVKEQNITALSEGLAEGDLSTWIESLHGLATSEAIPPAEVKNLPRSDWYDLQNKSFVLYGEDIGRVKQADDPKASDGSASIMTGDHVEWAVQAPLNDIAGDSGADNNDWTVYASIRIEKAGDAGNALAFGIYDGQARAHLVPATPIALARIKDDEYHLYRIGTVKLDPTRFVWIAPGGNSQVKCVSVDRFLFVRGNPELDLSPER
jgi:hypothetical protein